MKASYHSFAIAQGSLDLIVELFHLFDGHRESSPHFVVTARYRQHQPIIFKRCADHSLIPIIPLSFRKAL